MLILIKLATWMLSPLGIFFSLLFMGALFKRVRTLCWGLGVFSLVVFSNEWVAHQVLLPLEMRAQRLHETQKAEWTLQQKRPLAIVVLGGGMSAPIPPLRLFPELHDASDRVWHGARLFKQGVADKVIVSGGLSPGLQAGQLLTEAQAMAEFMEALGVPRDAIILESQARTTRENAEKTREILERLLPQESKGGYSIALVTSASHMARSIRNFENQGFQVLPYPIDFQSGLADKPFYRFLLPNAEALEQNQASIKEWIANWIGY